MVDGQRLDRCLGAGQEMPARRGPPAGRSARCRSPSSRRPASAPSFGLMLTTTTSKSLPASNDSVFRRAGHAVEHLRAEHRALVVGERQHDRACAEVVAQTNVRAAVVDERQVERQLLTDLLVDADLLEDQRFLARRVQRRLGRAHAPGRARTAARPGSQPSSPASARRMLTVRLQVPSAAPRGWGGRRGRLRRRRPCGRCRPECSARRTIHRSTATCVPSVGSARRLVAMAAPSAAAAPWPCRSADARRPRSCRPSRSCAGRDLRPPGTVFRSSHGVICSRGSGGSWPAGAMSGLTRDRSSRSIRSSTTNKPHIDV